MIKPVINHDANHQKFMVKCTSPFILLLFLFFNPIRTAAQDTLNFSAVMQSVHRHISYQILQKAYNELGYEIKLTRMTSAEALAQSSSGQTDGELIRIDGISRSYPDLVQVPIPITFRQGAAYSNRYFFPVIDWYDLNPYVIGIVEGSLYAERGTRGMKVIKAKSTEELFSLLDQRKIDIAISSRITGRTYMKSMPDLKEMEGIMETMFLYHYVHKKHAHLVPELSKVLKRMLLDGTTRKMKQQYLRKMNLEL